MENLVNSIQECQVKLLAHVKAVSKNTASETKLKKNKKVNLRIYTKGKFSKDSW
jgi:hypothetical protein